MSDLIERSEQQEVLSPALNAAGAAAPVVAAISPLAALLTRHVIQDGEIILLITKPSIAFIVLSMLRSAAVVFILMIASVLFDSRLPGHPRSYVEAGACLLAARLMWSLLQWTSRLYVLTNMRLVSLAGVMGISIFDCPLRKVARTRVLRSMRERIFGLGSIEIIPSDEELPITLWQTISKPLEVNDQIIAAINRARQGRGEITS